MSEPNDESPSGTERRDGENPRRVANRRTSTAPRQVVPSALAVNRSNKRAVYRQDFVATPPVMPASTEPPRSPGEMMHVWHPAPKATSSVKPAPSKPQTAREALRAKQAKHAAPRKQEPPQASRVELDPTWLSASGSVAIDAATQAGDAGEALVQAWLDGGNAAAIAILAGSESAPARARKAARRAVQVLKSRGVAIPEVAAVVAKPAASEAPPDCTASFIPPDGSGTCFYSFTQRLPDGRFRVADVMVRERVGVIHASLGHVAGKHLRSWKTRVENSFGVPPIPVPLEWARQAVAEGRRLNDTSKHIVPLGFDACLVAAGPAPSLPADHPVSDLEVDKPTGEQLAAAIAGSDGLHVEPEFGSWAPERAELQRVVARVGERLSATEIEDRERVDQVLAEEVAAATDRYFTPDTRLVLADRLRASAVALRSRRGDEVGRLVLTLAHAIRLSTSPRDVPFLRAFFEKGMGILARENQGRLPLPPRAPAP